ncbi:unnamed protein product [Danaus chrysippus]|uniref:(African queen) hypothetical protein n=1 Tax=Danaus chrysippus TaxID=151541 RepID=A0A8J2VV94_9NEOP|nr:unnamed protein product [Danaus chrysippus]
MSGGGRLNACRGLSGRRRAAAAFGGHWAGQELGPPATPRPPPTPQPPPTPSDPAGWLGRAGKCVPVFQSAIADCPY